MLLSHLRACGFVKPQVWGVLVFVFLALAAGSSSLAAPGLANNHHVFHFEPQEDQPLASKFFMHLLKTPAHTEEVLQRGEVVRQGERYQVRVKLRRRKREPATLFWLKVRVGKEAPIEVFFKPEQEGYRDWATEIAICRLAHYLDVRVPPCGERVFKQRVFADILAQIDPSFEKRLVWREGKIYGFVRLWAPAFTHDLGTMKSSRHNLLKLAGLFRLAHLEAVRSNAILHQLSDVILLDFLVNNNDRQWNLGTLRTSSKNLVLFPIDFGDGLFARPSEKHFCDLIFHRLGLFRKTVVQRLRTLDGNTLKKLFTRPDGGLLVDEKQIGRVLWQKKRALSHIAWLEKKFGEGVLYE